MNLLDLMIKVGIDDEASGAIDGIVAKAKSMGSAIQSGISAALSVGTAVVSGAAAGVTALTAAAVNSYADYEQLVGGVETLFKDSAGIVRGYADAAYTSAGLSANAYMETITSFAASMLQSLGGNTAEAAALSDQAVIDMADNANKMGTSLSMIQNAYQGFAKQNYTMLDNLKLGYGGTQKEMYRLMQTAAELDETFAKTAEFSLDEKGHLTAEFADITRAIHIVQTEMGITGTTSREAASTIQGSVASMKAAWGNMLTGIANEDADMSALAENLVSSATTALGNLAPRIGQAITGIFSGFSAVTGIDTSGLVEGLTTAFSGITTTLSEMTSAFQTDGITGAVTALVDGFERLTGLDLSGLSGMVETVGRAFSELSAAFQTDGMSGVIDMLVDGLGSLTGIDLSSVGDALKSILGVLEDASNAFQEDGITGVLETLAGAFQDMTGIDLMSVADSAKNLFETLQNVKADLIQPVVDTVKKFVETFKGSVGTEVSGVADGASRLFGAFLSITGELIGKIVTALGGFVTAIMPLAGGVLKTIGDALKFMADNMNILVPLFAGLTAGILAFKAAVLVTSMIDAFKNALNGLTVAQKAAALAQQLLNAAMNANPLGLIISLVVGIVTALVTFIATNDEAREKVIAAWNGLVEGIKGLIENVANWFSELGEKIKSMAQQVVTAVTGFITNIKNTFTNMWDGLTSGIQEGADKFLGFFRSFFKDAEETAMEETESHSPSRVYQRIGGYMAEGLRIGWQNGFANVMREVESSYNRLGNVHAPVMSVGFSDSALGIASAASINASIQSSQQGGGKTANINLNVDGRTVASAVYDPLNDIIWQKGAK